MFKGLEGFVDRHGLFVRWGLKVGFRWLVIRFNYYGMLLYFFFQFLLINLYIYLSN
jgi:hypothetical protein